MSLSKGAEKNQFIFSRNVDFTNTPLNEVKVEYMKKKIQLNWASNIVENSTDDLFQYVLKLEEHIKVLETKKEKNKKELKGSMKICNILIAASLILFLVFGTFSILTNSSSLLLITFINGFVLGIVYLYKIMKRKNIVNE